MLINFIFLWDNQTIVLSSDDECVLTRTRDPENTSLKAHVIIPYQSVTKHNSEKEPRSLSHNVINSTIKARLHTQEWYQDRYLFEDYDQPNAAAKTTFKPVSLSKVVIKQNLSSKTEIKPASLTKTAVKPSSSDGIYVSLYKLSDEFLTLLVYFC